MRFNRDLEKVVFVGFDETSVDEVGLSLVAKKAACGRSKLVCGHADVKNAVHQMRIPRWQQAYFALLAVLASDAGDTGKRRSTTPLVPATLPMSFSWAMFFCQGVTDCTLATSADSALLVVVTTPYPVVRRHTWHGISGFPLVVC